MDSDKDELIQPHRLIDQWNLCLPLSVDVDSFLLLNNNAQSVDHGGDNIYSNEDKCAQISNCFLQSHVQQVLSLRY